MIGLIPKPWLIFALVAAFALSNAITAVRFYRTGYGFAEARYTAELAKALAETAKKQAALVASVNRASEKAYAEQIEAESRIAGADAAVDRLRQAVGAANDRARSAADALADAATARTLLAECAGYYRDMAREADRLRAVVIGLQAYAREVSR